MKKILIIFILFLNVFIIQAQYPLYTIPELQQVTNGTRDVRLGSYMHKNNGTSQPLKGLHLDSLMQTIISAGENWFNTDLIQEEDRVHDGNGWNFTVNNWNALYLYPSAQFELAVGNSFMTMTNSGGGFEAEDNLAFGSDNDNSGVGSLQLAGHDMLVQIKTGDGVNAVHRGDFLQMSADSSGLLMYSNYALPDTATIANDEMYMKYDFSNNEVIFDTPTLPNLVTTAQIFDDFFGVSGGITNFGWLITSNNGTISVPSTDEQYNHPGLCVIESSGNLGAQTPIAQMTTSKVPVMPLHMFEALINTENFVASNSFFIGYNDGVGLATTNDFIGFNFNGSGNIDFTYCNGGGSSNTISTTVAEVSGNWVKVKFAFTLGGDIELYVNDVLEVTHTPTAVLPNATTGDFMFLGFAGEFTTSSAYRILVDYIHTTFKVTR